MKKKIINWMYLKAIKIVQKRLYLSTEKLTPAILTENGWTTEIQYGKTFFVEPNIKERDKVSIEFESHYYRVWHGKDRTFIYLESTVEWLQVYLLLMNNNIEFNNPNQILKR